MTDPHGDEKALTTVRRDGPPTSVTAEFTATRAGAHQLINESQAPARYVMFSANREPFSVVYPDSGKVSTSVGLFRIADAVDYWDGEPSE